MNLLSVLHLQRQNKMSYDFKFLSEIFNCSGINQNGSVIIVENEAFRNN